MFYDLIERGLQFARADALAEHPAIQALQPFNRHSASRIAHAALVQVKEYCGLWGHTGLPLKDILDWLGLTYGLDQEICRGALILGANKRGLHVDDGPNRHIFLKDHYEAECAIFRMVCALEGVRTKLGKTVLSKSARIMAGSVHECVITFCLEQRECLTGLIEWKLAILTGGPGTGKSTLITALNHHYEGLLVVAVAAKAALRAHEISGARHTTIFSVLEIDGGEERWLDGVRVLVIEEASMVGSIQMAKLLGAALHYGVQKIVLCGDPDQLARPRAGVRFVPVIEDDEIVGGCASPPRPATIKAAVTAFQELIAIHGPENVIVVAPFKDKPAGVKELNNAIRVSLGYGPEPCTGDLLMITKNSLDRSRLNGERYRAIAVAADRKIICARLLATKHEVILDIKPHDKGPCKNVDWGYAATVHKFQGSEAAATIVVIPSGTLKLMKAVGGEKEPWFCDRSFVYTASSRPKLSLVLIGDPNDICGAIKMNRSDRVTALSRMFEASHG